MADKKKNLYNKPGKGGGGGSGPAKRKEERSYFATLPWFVKEILLFICHMSCHHLLG